VYPTSDLGFGSWDVDGELEGLIFQGKIMGLVGLGMNSGDKYLTLSRSSHLRRNSPVMISSDDKFLYFDSSVYEYATEH
jgi:hypothetical protein